MPRDNPQNDEPSSLRTLFDSAESLRKELELTFDCNCDAYQEKLHAAVAAYSKCETLVDQMSLFSMNEGLEDVASPEIRYMLVLFHLGELSMKEKAENRKATLEKSRLHHRRFLARCAAYDLLSPSDEAALESESFLSTLPSDPAARRNSKIARYRKEKDLKSKLELLLQNSGPVDDDEIRTLHTASIKLAIMQSMQTLEMIALELEILSQAPAPEDHPAPPEQDERSQERASGDGYSDRLDQFKGLIKGGPLLSKDGKPLRPFTLVDQRSSIRKGVFGVGHNLPTMSIDEYLEEERRRGGIIEGGGEKSGMKPEPDEDNYEKADEETMKAREWDEYTEANPRGSGNTLNRG